VEGTSSGRQEDIKILIGEIEGENVDFIQLEQRELKWHAFVRKVIKIRDL
jgi:hypothetical protein